MSTFKFIGIPLAYLIIINCFACCSDAQEINLLPKYGTIAKNAVLLKEDSKFISSIDKLYKGNRRKASEDLSARGWQFLRQGNLLDAMRRFNQAWLLDPSNGVALWGMAVIQASSNKMSESLSLFTEAEPKLINDIDFRVDHAKTIGFAGAQTGDKELLKDAFKRFEAIYQKSPTHTLNLQNWAITLFYVGNYAEAWKKIKLAEAGPASNDLDQNFIAALKSKMPRD